MSYYLLTSCGDRVNGSFGSYAIEGIGGRGRGKKLKE